VGSIVPHSHRARRALAGVAAAAFAVLVVVGPAHTVAHGRGSADCHTCHVVRHVPATLAGAATYDVDVLVTPLPVPPPPRPASGRVPRPQSRGPPR